MYKTKEDASLTKMRYELKIHQLKRERELLELERKHEPDILELRSGCLGRIFGCC